MLDINKKTVIILAHLDDEFAFSPIIKKIANQNSKNIKVIYCAERVGDSFSSRILRRDESIKSMALLGVNKKIFIT